jgi:hypothetical protein
MQLHISNLQSMISSHVLCNETHPNTNSYFNSIYINLAFIQYIYRIR